MNERGDIKQYKERYERFKMEVQRIVDFENARGAAHFSQEALRALGFESFNSAKLTEHDMDLLDFFSHRFTTRFAICTRTRRVSPTITLIIWEHDGLPHNIRIKRRRRRYLMRTSTINSSPLWESLIAIFRLKKPTTGMHWRMLKVKLSSWVGII